MVLLPIGKLWLNKLNQLTQRVLPAMVAPSDEEHSRQASPHNLNLGVDSDFSKATITRVSTGLWDHTPQT